MRGGLSFLLWGTAACCFFLLSTSHLYAQAFGEIKVRDLNKPYVQQNYTDQNDPPDTKRSVNCKTYVVDMRKGRRYIIDLNSTQFFAFLRIEDKAGTELASNNGSDGVQNAKLDFTPPKDGIYRIMVESVGGATGQYTFKITPDMTTKAESDPPVPQVVYLPPIFDDDDLEGRPSVFRAGKLPPGLPDWFQKLDTDGDGQVALWEWRKGGKKLEDFLLWDLNEDGFITAEEALRKLELDRMAGAPKRPG